MMILFLVVVMFCLLAKSREAHVCLWLCVFLSPCRLKSPLATEPKQKLQSRPLQTDTTDHYSDAQATGPAAASGLPSPIPSSPPPAPLPPEKYHWVVALRPQWMARHAQHLGRHESCGGQAHASRIGAVSMSHTMCSGAMVAPCILLHCIASCGIRAHNLPLTKRVLCQLS